MNDTSKTNANDVADEITLRLEQAAGTAFMVLQGAAATCADIPSNAPLVAGFALRDELLSVRELIRKLHQAALDEGRAAPASDTSSTGDAEPATAASTGADPDDDEALIASRAARRRSNQFFADNTLDTLNRVHGGIALLGRLSDAEDHDEDAEFGRYHLIESLRCAIEAEADRIRADRQQDAAA